MGHTSSAGLHLIADGYVENPSVFTRETIERLFSQVVSALDMKALDLPHIYEVPVDPEVLKRVQETGKFEDEGGITAVCVISTSHLSIHCWPLQSFFSLDVFSCKSFNSDVAFSIIREVLGVKQANVTVLQRRRPL